MGSYRHYRSLCSALGIIIRIMIIIMTIILLFIYTLVESPLFIQECAREESIPPGVKTCCIQRDVGDSNSHLLISFFPNEPLALRVLSQ